MAKKESTQHKLDRVRAPRVQLTYDVEVGDAIEKKELPFVAGVVGNFSGQPAEPLGKLKDRKFVNVDKDNYDDVLKGMKPRVQMQVDNKLADDGSKLGVELNFRSLEDFSPERVVNQIDPLRKLLEARQKLADLRNKAAGNDKFEDLLNEVLQNTDKIAQLSKEVGPKSEESSGERPATPEQKTTTTRPSERTSWPIPKPRRRAPPLQKPSKADCWTRS